jgi:L-arabinose isomerase
VFSQNIGTEILQDFAEIAGIELTLINKEMGNINHFKNELRQNEAIFK